jgi:hypothetical protein
VGKIVWAASFTAIAGIFAPGAKTTIIVAQVTPQDFTSISV